MAKSEIVIPVEKVIHDSLRQIAETVWETHGICIKNVHFYWINVSGPDEQRFVLSDIEVETLTK